MRSRFGVINSLIVFAAIFVSILLLHLPLLRLPYFWDEAGYFVPAARDLLHLGDFIPRYTLSNAHPPLVIAYLAACWRLFGENFITTRVAMLVVSTLTLLALFRLARRVVNVELAIAAVLCTMLYPVFFAQSTLAHLDMAAAMFTLWGLVFYLPRAPAEMSEAVTAAADIDAVEANAALSRRLLCAVMFALAALAKETAVLAPLAIMGWELLRRWYGWRRARTNRRVGSILKNYFPPPVPLRATLLLLLSLLPLALWFAYHYSRTGYVFGNPEFFRYNVEATLTPERILVAFLSRLWQITGHMNLFVLTLGASWAMLTRSPLPTRRGGIAAPVRAVFFVVILAYVSGLSIVGGAVLARYLLPILPLVILLCVSTVWRRVRRWRLVIAIACMMFVAGWFVNPPHRFPWEENLAYRDYVILHKDAAGFIAAHYPSARVLTTWTATDELTRPHLGYVPNAMQVVAIKHFSVEQFRRIVGEGTPFDLVLLFSTNFYDDVRPEQAAAFVNAEIVYRNERRGQWVAVLAVQKTSRPAQ